ncbi:DsbC/DsbD-like thiol-disulfide interchange protein [Microvirga flocculans]|uniref:DsbC/DsbD-like thiol-disulfide interchange protein n=1 Tax=Microvirga flocculans TaxID=217168 RepID=A0A7W6N7I4_9HYPH|nr:protein-disulfide reductase DsbD domain-containing protein [Microvirga flocculans]MBB4040138.1 DsbC/DsbD-like thiol-disulfide interchange protein [Microvirga flocculans]
MAFMLRAASAALFLIVSLEAAVAQPLASSATTQGFHSRTRLISGGAQGDHWLAGIEISLDEGFKTYWRTPGDSGLPPRFDWTGSENVESADIKWPAPARHEDAAGITYAYGKKVVLPVVVKAKDATRPVRLVLSAEYGICKDICIPAQANLSLDLSGAGADRGAIETALAKVPVPQPLGAPAELSVLSVAPASSTPDKPALSVTVRAPSGTVPALFAEGPENWYLSTSKPDGDNRVTVTIEDKPRDASGPVPLRLTLVAGDKAVETEIGIDGSGRPR